MRRASLSVHQLQVASGSLLLVHYDGRHLDVDLGRWLRTATTKLTTHYHYNNNSFIYPDFNTKNINLYTYKQ